MALRIRHNACPACTGDLHPLGALGNLAWYRCRHCGMDVNRKIRRKPAKRK